LNTLSTDAQIQKMLTIIYQIPMGVIESDTSGHVKQINAKGVQLLWPVFVREKLAGDNILDLVKIIAPGMAASIEAFTPSTGSIINQQHEVIRLTRDSDNLKKHYYFTVNKLSPDQYVYLFDDITDLYDKEQALSQALLDKAVNQSKFELAAGLLHDIGNAVTGFGAYIHKIQRSTEQNDIETLQKLKLFVESQMTPLSSALGPARTAAIVDLLNGIISNQKNSLALVSTNISAQMVIVSHIQEILHIQRQYVVGQSMERTPVNLANIITDCVAMLADGFDKNKIAIAVEIPASVPSIKGDRTRLMQVMLNLLKNSIESFADGGIPERSIHVSLVVGEGGVEITISDTGSGFENGTGDVFFEKGVTSKTGGGGVGLANCRSIIKSHNGTIELHSNGRGRGATARISLAGAIV